MKVHNSNTLTKLAGIVGVTGVSFFISLPIQANEAAKNELLNPNPGIFSEAPYSQSQRVLTNTQYTPAAPVAEADKNKKPRRRNVSQRGGNRGVNPKPSIFDECPYNRALDCSGGASRTPRSTTPTPKPTEQPSPTPEPTTPETPTTEPTTPGATPEKPGTTPVKPVTPGTPGTSIPDKKPSAGASDKTVLALAESNGEFTMLTKALKAAGLEKTLQGKGPFTVFAPTDKAFAELPQDAVRDLLKPENKEVLSKILRYHVVQGSVLSSDLKPGEVKTVEGGPINVKVDADKVMVNEANVVKADIKGSNGVIHAIDKVILPPDL